MVKEMLMETKERIKVTFHPDKNSNYTYWIPDVAEMSEATLNKDLAEHASKYLWFASLCARLMAKRDNLSGVVKSATANKEMVYREKAKVSGEKSTEGSIKAQVETDEELLELKSFLAEAESELQMCMTIKDAFYHRKDCLVTLGANIRQEMRSLTPDNIKE